MDIVLNANDEFAITNGISIGFDATAIGNSIKFRE